jgi:hypothetical protein
MKISLMTPMNVDFNHPERCAQTRLLSCTVNGKAVIPTKLNWSHLLIAITERLIAEGNPHLAELDKVPLYGSKLFFLPTKPPYGTCALLSNSKWISTNYSPQTIVVIIRNLCCHCGVRLGSVIICYLPKDMPTERFTERRMGGNTKKAALSTVGSSFTPEVVREVSDVLSAHFPNGFLVDSPIELMRFRNYAAKDSAEGIPLADKDLLMVINSCGTLFEGKVYVVAKETEIRIKEKIDDEVSRGAEILFYSSIFARYENWLFSERVVSEAMLKGMLEKIYPSYQHKTNCFLPTNRAGVEPSIIKREILRVWNGDTLLSYEQISNRLPFVPIEKIKLVMAQNGDFIWNSNEVYTHLGMIDISDEERVKIEEYVAIACRTVGYASMNDVPQNEISEINNELSLTAIHNAIFEIVLSNNYDKRGKIVTRKGDTLDALTIIKEHCRSIDRCSLQDLLDYGHNLTGETNLSIPMEAGYAVLVRIAEDTYVADKFIRFEVDKIDEILDIFVKGQYLPLKRVTTFAAFPDCGQVWNLFLLESYCRRFSRRFRFEVPSVNSRNAGAIVRKDCELGYIEIMADAVAFSDTDLIKADVLEFLSDAGYIGRKSSAKIDRIIELAKNLRERRI